MGQQTLLVDKKSVLVLDGLAGSTSCVAAQV